MYSFPFQVFLVLTVTCSQIFAGVSCCCLPRLVASCLRSSTTTDATEVLKPSILDKGSVSKCPRCAAVKARKQASQDNNRDSVCSIANDVKCNCHKAWLQVLAQDEPQKLHVCHQFFIPSVPRAARFCDGLELVRFRHEIPFRLGGHSWQAIACIWRN